MKTASIIILIFTIISCAKKDRINHYLNIPVTQKELVDNGFYRYSYTDTIYDWDKGDYIIKDLVKYDMCSNVKPEKNKEGEVGPTQLRGIFKLDSLQEKRNWDYFKNDLDSRVITYFFRNDILSYKSIIVDTVSNYHKKTADFTSKEKILKYYDSLNVPLNIILEGNLSSEKRPTLFMINNYNTSIQYASKDPGYDMFVNYLDDFIDRNILQTWYFGGMNKVYYDF
ncbi:hypothetical protein [Flavobacterium hercynium]|uniref:Lipoprotein n=1 Tax=Flavobacterium hercynium TaxID=387094 RepID=A0A226H057_9FLAO|nr:hypothetical protein [Flavobacterium hercynium]OXA86890.1 hypothetical protein B0A66_17120 [Flavobacterium hercynium]SMP13142.1 hypothetical protein SAMN06265346_103304 [Flavobacterium hercynium]